MKAGPATRALITATALLATGCAYHPRPHIVRDATDYNLAVEEANNRMLVLNVLRAKDRREMVFTGISQLNGNISTTLSSGDLAFSIGADRERKAALGPSVSFTTNPQFTMGVLDSEAFYRGLLTPVSGELVAYLGSQGWSPEVLLALLVERIDLNGNTYENDPEDEERWCQFWRTARSLFCKPDAQGRAACELKVEQEYRDVGPELTETQAKSLEGLIAMEGAKLSLGTNAFGSYYQLRALNGSSFVVEGNPESKRLQILTPHKLQRSPVNPVSADSPAIAGQITLRSPQGVLYYLGEIARTQLDPCGSCSHRAIPPIGYIRTRNGKEVPLFQIRKYDDPLADKTDKGAIVVEYLGEKYFVGSTNSKGSEESARSMQALALAHILLSLHKSSEDMPKTQSVNVVGGTPRP